MRAFTAQETKEIEAAENELRDVRFDVDGPGATDNAKLILDYFSQHAVPVTRSNIYNFINQNKDKFVWLSSAAAKYYTVARNSDEQLVNSATAWLNGRQKLLVREGDEGLENLTLLLQELRGWSFTDLNAQAAIGRAQAKNQRVHFVPDRSQDSYQNNPRRHSGSESFMPKSETNRSDISRFLAPNHSDTPSQQPASLSITDQKWKAMAENLLRTGRTHSQNAELESEFNRHVTAGSSWRKTYEAVSAVKDRFDKLAAISGNSGR